MLKSILFSLFLSLSLFVLPSPIHSQSPIPLNQTVSATVPSLSAPASPTPNQAPTPPVLYSPTDGQLTSNPRLPLVWYQSTDPDGNTLLYDLYLDGIATFLGISNLGSSAGTGYTTSLDGSLLYLIPSFDLTEGTHNWSLRAYDLAGASSSSTSWQFTLDLTPPYLLVTAIDTIQALALDSREPSTVPPDTTFELRGPQDVYFTVETELGSTVELTITNIDTGQVITNSVTATNNPVYPHLVLDPGTYSVQLVAIDRVGYTSALPAFKLVVSATAIPLPALSPLPIPPQLIIPPAPALPPGYSATVQQISTRYSLTFIIVTLLAFIIFFLLLLLRRKPYNLLLLSPDGTPLPKATVFHTRPLPGKYHLPLPRLGKPKPVKHELASLDKGRLYLPSLGRYSTLTITTPSQLLILSVAYYRRPLLLIVG